MRFNPNRCQIIQSNLANLLIFLNGFSAPIKTLIHFNSLRHLKWHQQKNQDALLQQKSQHQLRKPLLIERDVVKPSQYISTVSSNRFIPRPVSPRSPCQSWTPSSMTSLRRLPASHPVSFATTKSTLYHPEKYRLLSVFSYLVSLLNTPSQKEPRLSPNIPVHDSLLRNDFALWKSPL